jgi:hypothetical protein
VAKLPTPTGNSWDMGSTVVVYADGIDEVDVYGPNARLTFWMAERDHEQGVRKAVAARVIIPTAELVRIARQLLAPEVTADPGEQSKQVATLQ